MEKKVVSKLVVLDLNGLLIQRTYVGGQQVKRLKSEAYIVSDHAILKRPGLDDFLDFVFSNFRVGVWSSMREHNIVKLLPLIFGKRTLYFVWDQSRCWQLPQLNEPTLFLKPLKVISAAFPHFTENNVLMCDDTPAKLEENPKSTNCLVETWTGAQEDNYLLKHLKPRLEEFLLV